jgi:hypothetical protein
MYIHIQVVAISNKYIQIWGKIWCDAMIPVISHAFMSLSSFPPLALETSVEDDEDWDKPDPGLDPGLDDDPGLLILKFRINKYDGLIMIIIAMIMIVIIPQERWQQIVLDNFSTIIL